MKPIQKKSICVWENSLKNQVFFETHYSQLSWRLISISFCEEIRVNDFKSKGITNFRYSSPRSGPFSICRDVRFFEIHYSQLSWGLISFSFCKEISVNGLQTKSHLKLSLWWNLNSLPTSSIKTQGINHRTISEHTHGLIRLHIAAIEMKKFKKIICETFIPLYLVRFLEYNFLGFLGSYIRAFNDSFEIWT